jgi:energy-coupling factor transporter ATP-binding protein EcfA2
VLVDFYQILVGETKDKSLELYPDFIIGRSEDLMVQGGKFYAIWDPEKGLWSRDEYDVQRLVDEDLAQERDRLQRETGQRYTAKFMRSWGSSSWARFRKFMAHISDNSKPLDNRLMFANTDVKKTDYASRKLPYAIGEGDISAWDELTSTLYSPDERAKIEWAIGSIVSGDSKKIQKFFVLYGPPGTGKSTILNIIEWLFEGYTTTFDGKALGSSNASFATEVFRFNPLVAIQHDGDLSKIEDNARLNSIIAHEQMVMNEKYKSSYSSRIDAMLFIGSNQPVRISDAKSGIIRRLIDIHPTGVKFGAKHYQTLMTQIGFELGAIAHHCLQTYLSMGKNYYNTYRPLEMMLQTDVFFNFIEAHYDTFKKQDYVTLKQAYLLYKEYCSESGIERPMPQYKMREELRNYFQEFRDREYIDGETVRSVYRGFTAEKFKQPTDDKTTFSLVLEETKSLLDAYLADYPAQLARDDGQPTKRWTNVKTTLSDIDSRKIHYVKVPENHVVIDFDLKDQNGHKALERNLEVASQFPATYAEISKSGSGIHLHYSYDGDVTKLSPVYAEGIEVKVYSGDAALRRRLSRCNGVPVSKISSGLPLRDRKDKMLKAKTIQSEQGLRELIKRNLRKEIHPGTKPSMDFIKKILDDAYESGMKYDVTDLRTKILAFANNSSNQAQACLAIVSQLKLASADVGETKEEAFTGEPEAKAIDDRLVFFDVEVYPNLFVICWKFQGTNEVVKMLNPKPHEVSELFKFKLVGFYNRRYDNHILYAAAMGASNEELFKLSKKMVIDGNRSATFAQAYNLSYADIYDFSSVKQSLKKFEVNLGILHMELDIPWDQPVDEKDWERVVEYCANDVVATEAVFEDRRGDYVARQILAELSGLTVNDTTQNHTAKILFGDKVRTAHKEFVYSDLAKDAGGGVRFPGYEYSYGKSSYKGENPGEGGYVYAEPGIYSNVAVLDVASMHPNSILQLNAFGPYTQKFEDLIKARIAIKRKDFDAAAAMLDGRLLPFLSDPHAGYDLEGADKLAYALKIVINQVYGLTSAKFDNPFRDIRNVDNIVAKRGALFMIDLKRALQEKGVSVVHIKTDSVKIPDATPEIVKFVTEFGAKYGYEFEHEETYDKFCLVNDAVYVAGIQTVPWEEGHPKYHWTAVGAQFQHPYVFKTLFSGEELIFEDYCEARSVVKGTMYLYAGSEKPVNGVLEASEGELKHVGRTGLFVPVRENGAALYRFNDDKYYAVAGTKGHLWMEADAALEAGEKDDLEIDMTYFEKLREDAVKAIEKFGSFEEFVS